MNKIWWEKTVEYKFICDYCGHSLLMPLDGAQEKAGDTILSNSKKFMLIEFKKEFKNIKDELKKFNIRIENDIPNKIKNLGLKSLMFHKIIYGTLENEKFILQEVNYWDGLIKSLKGNTFDKNIFKNGIELKKFKAYIEIFINLKKAIITNESGSNSFANYTNVLGIDSNGNVNQVISLNEFAKEILNENLDNKQTLNQNHTLKYNSGPKL